MTKPALVILAAGMGSRYGGLKQVAPVGPSGETIMDYAIFDALRTGFNKVVFVIRRDFAEAFHQQIGTRYTDAIEVAYAFQELTDLPQGFTLPATRAKPWGTAHAIRAARHLVTTPFAAINADDFYGRDAFQRLAHFLARPAPRNRIPAHFAMVGYRLDQTLSDYGTVARGICSTDQHQQLLNIQEMTRLIRTEHGVENRAEHSAPTILSGTERVSMNFWGFTPELFTLLEETFPAWLTGQGATPEAEWYIPYAVDTMLRAGKAEVELLPTESAWFGITYREDQQLVEKALANLIAAGEYPTRLW